jgi:hypothetical protein
MPKHQQHQLAPAQLPEGTLLVDLANLCAQDSSPTVNTLHFIMAHSKEHSEWASHAKNQLINSLLDLVPNVIVSVDLLLLAGTQADVMKSLVDYHAIYSKREADRTLIITPGWWESQVVVLANANAVLPYKQLFCLPSGEPSKLLEKILGVNAERSILGGVYNMEMPSERYVHSIIGFRPQTKKVCIAYDSNTTNELLRHNIAHQVADLTARFAEVNIEVILHCWTPQDMNVESLRIAAHEVDSVIILNEPAAAVHKKSLIRFCNAWNIFVCSSELDSVFEGAALGCGVSGAAFGAPLAGLIIEYLFLERGLEHVEGWSLHRIPQQSGMRFNQWAFEIQGIQLPKDREELIYMKSVFDQSCIEY